MFTPTVSENILFYICGLGILQGIILAFFLYFHPKSNRPVNIYLALYIFFVVTVMTLPFTLKVIGWHHSYFVQPLPYLSGPFLYFYLLRFSEKITWRKALPHFIPFVLGCIFTYWNLSVLGAKYPDAKIVPGEVLHSPGTVALSYSKLVQMIFYFVLCRRVLSSYQRSVRQWFSETSRIDLHWAKTLVYGFGILMLTFMFIFPLMLSFPEHFNILFLVNMVIAVPYVYIAAYKGLLQPGIWQVSLAMSMETIHDKIEKGDEPGGEGEKTTPGLPEEKINEIAAKILAVMETEKLYEEPELTLKQLAEKIQVPSYQVTQVIREGMKKNFYNLVNGYRVEEAKRLLSDPDNNNYTILSVGFEAGFNSKTTFNTVFKRFTGLTPTEYRGQQNAEIPEVK